MIGILLLDGISDQVFGRRIENGESKWVNSMKKSINHSTSLVLETFWGLSCGFKI